MTASTKLALEPVGLTVQDVARILQVSTRQVWRLSAANDLPQPRHVGQRARWDKGELERWWADQAEQAR